MKRIRTISMVTVICLGRLGTLAPTLAGVDEGISRHIPWSGYWWPIGKGELLEPLRKYDRLTGKRAYWWELENKPPGPQVPPWHGYCHGWAAAAVTEEEPVSQRLAKGLDGQTSVLLNVGAQKGWYSVGHAYDVANQYGDRYGDDEGSEDTGDMAPDMLWQVLKMFLQEHRLPLVMDLDAGKEVWNYPVFAYRISYEPLARGGGWHSGQLKLWAADDAVQPQFVGTVPYLQTYTFIFQMRDGAVMMGSGRWTGQSVWNHPDFAWYPYIANPENPEIDYDTVQTLIQTSTPQADPTSTAGATRDQPGATGSQANKAKNRKRETAKNRLAGITAGKKPPVEAWVGQSGDPGDNSHDQADIPLPISPMQLVATIAKKTSSFGLDARLADFGKVRYHVGEHSEVTGSSERAGYLYVLHVSPTGDLSLLYPAPGENSWIEAGAVFHVPGSGQGPYTHRKPYGNHRIKVLVTQRRLILTGLDRRAPLGAGGASQPKAEGLATGGADSRPWYGYAFRFLPAQAHQIKEMLTDYVQSKQLDAKRFEPIDANPILSGFAQDEITYYVGPSESEVP